jgi:simple sugar transport system substrate-binding protein
MRTKTLWGIITVLVAMSLVLAACTSPATPTPAPQQPAAPAEPAAPAAPQPAPQDEEFVFGMLLVGPYNDHGYSQAHYEAGQYVEEKMPGARMIYLDRVNPADRQGTTGAQLAEDLYNRGAKVIVFNSDDMKEDALEFARNHPDIPVIHASGDAAWTEGHDFQNQANIANIMGRMEYGKMIGGCAAALTTQTGNIGYLGPLINDETRRLTASAYLGARHCWTEILGRDPADLRFRVTWIGFWFNIPGFTSDPTQVANDFFNSGFDVVISGIDTTEALTEAARNTQAGRQVWAVPYDFVGACAPAPEVCLGVPYFNWGPDYLEAFQSVRDGSFESFWIWSGPDWSDINNHDTSAIGYVKGPALAAEASSQLDRFIADLAGGLNLWTGPLNLQDGTQYLAAGEVATDQQVWYLPSLLEGMEGQAVSE